ncbi:hypothetical protein HUJ04_005027 [Dendroctonus ponderosae]|nr:hypothetical protein HUJ04_005027 [Dendroctonus ponderosae]KAH1007843.1 hypothetical protein HUJ04_005027 [Dendroctonus ponderosae]KAH1015361.1 hypothetical protein HUJ05_013095 [Dendroctonus ponderosae]KAH1015362.1 hypothetical protein HUJ05_013095 [Dendroctonus ponderosae]
MLSFIYLNEYFLILCLAGFNMATPTVDRDDIKNVKYEEYVIEHEISSTQARNVALSTDINAIIVPAGCQECTKEEKHYCMSADLISDHCCCDRRFHGKEKFGSGASLSATEISFAFLILHVCFVNILVQVFFNF